MPGSFTPVSAGNPTLATDINQLLNALNGTTNSTVTIANTSTNVPYTALFTSVPTSTDKLIFKGAVSGDGQCRVSLYVRYADGLGGLQFGDGTNVRAHFYGTTGGAKLDESLSIGTNLTVAGATTLQGTSVTGTLSLNGSPVPVLFGGGSHFVLLGSNPGSGYNYGDIWFDASGHVVRWWNGSTWVAL
jgi:hypothetical protein